MTSSKNFIPIRPVVRRSVEASDAGHRLRELHALQDRWHALRKQGLAGLQLHIRYDRGDVTGSHHFDFLELGRVHASDFFDLDQLGSPRAPHRLTNP